jgi:hypothetical protein
VDVVRAGAFTPGMTAKALLHRRQITETTPGLRLVDPATGELRANPVHFVQVPSHSEPAREPWEIRVSWHPNSVAVWHHGDVCPAYENLGRCWHLLGAVLRIAYAYHGGEVPGFLDLEPETPEPSVPARPRPEAYAAGFYD